ncbi:MAG: hypothetical protein ACI35Q_08285 [Marinilabiliaceae bacterium]
MAKTGQIALEAEKAGTERPDALDNPRRVNQQEHVSHRLEANGGEPFARA